MTTLGVSHAQEARSASTASLDMTADVLVTGGGLAAAWAACSAAASGASVVLADEGFSGVVAPLGTGVSALATDDRATSPSS